MLEQEGRVWFRGALSRDDLSSLDEADANEARPGARLRSLPGIEPVTALARSLLPGARAVRVVAFNKTDSNNWTLPWHQDRVVALEARVESPGFANWTNKAGIWHAEPPTEFLSRMIFARVHLDPADTDNGCLQLALGTHALGKVAAAEAEVIAKDAETENCIAARGDILFAKALILHRSSPSRVNAGRRAIRIDYCADHLPASLQWAA